MIAAKWLSIMRHISDRHTDHPTKLFEKCVHQELEPRDWVYVETGTFDKLITILKNKRIVNDIKKLSPDTQTSSLESFHAVLNFWQPKTFYFSWIGAYCRQILANLHFNENLHREIKKKHNGEEYVHVWYPKFRDGQEVVWCVSVPPTYDYVEEMKRILFEDFEDHKNRKGVERIIR